MYQRACKSDDGLTLAYRDYPVVDAGSCRLPVVCLHGLTRTSRDFEDLAPRLSEKSRVIALDFRGRGLSDRDPDSNNYHPMRYVDDVISVMRHAGIERAVLIGTSLGGLVSMGLAQIAPARVAGVVLNDVGTELDPRGIERISRYVGKLLPVNTWAEAAAQQKRLYGQGLPDYTGEDWLRHARRGFREAPSGKPIADSDPKIASAVKVGNTASLEPGVAFDALLKIPTLLVRGQLSDILSVETVANMVSRKPDLQTIEVPGRGHAPMLDEPVALEAIGQFLGQFEQAAES